MRPVLPSLVTWPGSKMLCAERSIEVGNIIQPQIPGQCTSLQTPEREKKDKIYCSASHERLEIGHNKARESASLPLPHSRVRATLPTSMSRMPPTILDSHSIRERVVESMACHWLGCHALPRLF